jgi:hypothetical protein
VPPKLDADAVAHLHALCDRGLPHTHIGRMLGISNVTVGRYRRKQKRPGTVSPATGPVKRSRMR